MKTTLLIAAFCAACVLVSSEDCRQTSDCRITTCAPGAHIGCVEGKCSCLNDHDSCPASCSAKSDCDACRCPDLRDEHCVDQRCRCFAHGPGGPIGK